MEIETPDSCQIATADSTTQTSASPSTAVVDVHNRSLFGGVMRSNADTSSPQQVSSTNTNKKGSPPPATNNNNNNNNNNKVKAQQQQQQYHQFRAPQQFVRQRRAPPTNVTLNNKKNKTWNKRQQQKCAKQQQQQQQQQQYAQQSAESQAPNAGGIGAVGATLTTTKADLENIQNFKNQVSGGHHFFHHGGGGGGHRGGGIAAGNGLPPSTLSGLEKLGYGHGQLKLYKKMLAQRGGGGHHHVLCAGAAHNTIGGMPGGAAAACGNSNCCLLNGCNGGVQSGKDSGSINSLPGVASAAAPHYCCNRSKFFLPDKRLRKEIIIPPTKFLLGGNISDPLNLNSLQNENSNASSNNNTPATTPRQSPITTPPKVEVIIPPNIRDPLHLLDPVDSMEYEKQLTSPMKRGSSRGHGAHQHSAKHRHRKNRKTKRRRYDSYNTSAELSGGDADERNSVGSSLANSTASTDVSASLLLDNSGASSINMANNSSTCERSGAMAIVNTSSSANTSGSTMADVELMHDTQSGVEEVPPLLAAETYEKRLERSSISPVKQCAGAQLRERTSASTNVPPSGGELSAASAGPSGIGGVVVPEMAPLPMTRERANRELRLDLSGSTCGSNVITGANNAGGMGCAGAVAVGGGRKRKISEGNNSQKNKKFHRLDAMNKIVSPVVPQPGAWKRPPRLAATGARKPARRSTSVSETEILSPADEVARSLLGEAELLRVETPDFNKLETISEVGLGSPLSTISGATSVAAGEQDSLNDTSAGENSTSMTPVEECQSKATATTAATTIATNAMTAIAQLTALPRFRPDGAKYRYGNYDRYVGFRNLNEFMDVRLKVFRGYVELFQNKDVLDIGCNAGHMTIAVARNFAPKSILGIDIDKKLVGRARQNLALHVRIPMETPATSKNKAPSAPLAVNKEKKPSTSIDTKMDTAESTQTAVINTDANAAVEVATATDAKADAATSTACTSAKRKKTRRRKKQKCTTVPLQHHHNHMHHHHHHHQQQLQKLHVPATELFPVSFPLSYGGMPTATAPASVDGHSPSGPTNTPGHTSSATTGMKKSLNDFPRNVFFRHSNYVLKDESQLNNDSQQYDLILCLSVTKWIHLNFGDAGLKLAFKRMFNQLRPGGKLILEAQNWASYKKKKSLTPEIYENYRNIEFFPNKFHEYLLSSEVGFSHSYTLGVPKHLSKGFCRPIQLYAKGDYTPNHARWSDAYYPQTPYEAYRGIYATMPPRPAGMASYTMSSTRSQAYDTPHYTGGASGPYSCRQTPMYQPMYNPLETDSYLPSYDMEYLNHMYVFASPLYQTIWSPPASLRNSSSHTPLFGSVREAELDGDGSGGGGGGSYHRHVYPPNDDISSPNANAGGAFNSIRDPDTDDSNQLPAGRTKHVYATNCGESSSSPQVQHQYLETIDEGLMLADDEHVAAGASGTGARETPAHACNGERNAAQHHYCDLNDA